MKTYIAVTIFLVALDILGGNNAAQIIEGSSGMYDQQNGVSLDFEQYELNLTTGLYFDEIGNLQVYHSEWAFVTYVNLTYFTTEAENLLHTVETIQLLCNSIKDEMELQIPRSYCDSAMPRLQALAEDIKDYNTKWFINYETVDGPVNSFRRLRRKRRGFFGSISKTLFCSMSEEEAEFYKTQINVLKNENIEHVLLTHNQTTLFQESLKILNDTISSQIVQRSALQKQLDEIEHLLNNSTASNILSNKLIELIFYASSALDGLSKKQRDLYEAITRKSSGFQWIPPQIFKNELERVSILIAHQELRLPLSLTGENLAKFYQMATTEARIIDNNLVIRISVPLVETKKFILYRAISVPKQIENSDRFSFVEPHNKYIAFDSINEKFITLTYDELNLCHQFDRKNRLCKQTFPIMNARNSKGCEISIIRNHNQTSNCDTQIDSLAEDVWTKLQRPNTYLYTLLKRQQVAIVCPHARTKIELERTGIISIKQRCKIKTEQFEIVALDTMEIKVMRNFTLSPKLNVNVTAEIDNVKNIKSLSNPNLPDISDDAAKKVTNIHNDLQGLNLQDRIKKASVLHSLNTDKPSNFSPILLIIIGVIVIVVSVLFAILCFKYCAIQGCNILVIFFLLIVLGIFYFI